MALICSDSKNSFEQVGGREQHQAAEVVGAAGVLEALGQLAQRDRRLHQRGLDDIAAAIPEILPGVVGGGVLVENWAIMALLRSRSPA